MKKSTIIVIISIVFVTIIFGLYLFKTNARNTTADIYLENCLKSTLALENADVNDTFLSCEWVVSQYRKYGEWKF